MTLEVNYKEKTIIVKDKCKAQELINKLNELFTRGELEDWNIVMYEPANLFNPNPFNPNPINPYDGPLFYYYY